MTSQLVGKAFNGYTLKKYIGSGTYGEVFLATKVISGKVQLFAIKLFEAGYEGEEEIFDNEVAAYEELSKYPTCFEYIVCMVESFQIPSIKRSALVLDYMGGGDLFEYSSKYKDGVPPLDLVLIMRETLTALKFIHDRGMAHGDIKPENILRNLSGNTYKLADLGAVCKKPPPPPQKCVNLGTAMYLSPELARKPLYARIPLEESQKADIWALGLVFWQLAFGFGKAPINNSMEDKTAKEVVQSIAKVTSQKDVQGPYYSQNAGNVSAIAINVILYWMLAYDPKERRSASFLLDYLLSEIRGCSILGKKYTREDIIKLISSDTKLGDFLRSKQQPYDDLTTVGTLCGWLTDYFVKVVPVKPKKEVSPRARPKKRKKTSKKKKTKHKKKTKKEKTREATIEEKPAASKVPSIKPQAMEIISVEAKKKEKAKEKPIPSPKFIKGVQLRAPPPPPIITDKEIFIRALQECAVPGKLYSCGPKALETVSKLILTKHARLPRTIKSYEAVKASFAGKSGEASINQCLLCLYLSYRKLALIKGLPDPGIPESIPGQSQFKCIIINQNASIDQMKILAKQMGIPIQGTKASLCSEIYSALLLNKKISRQNVARDIYQGLVIAAYDDTVNGVPPLQAKSTRVAQEQTGLIEAILNVAMLGKYETIDVDYLRQKKLELEQDLQKIGSHPQGALKTRQFLTMRTLKFLTVVLNHIFGR